MKKIVYLISFAIAIALLCSISHGMPLPLLPDSVQPLDPEEIVFYLHGEELSTQDTHNLTTNNLDLFNTINNCFHQFSLEKESFTAFLWNLYKNSHGMKESDLRSLPIRLQYPEICWTITKEKRSYPQLVKLPDEHTSYEQSLTHVPHPTSHISYLSAPPFLDEPGMRFQIKLE